jgi:transcriptional regulator with XRE-family HTH domain
MNPAKRKKLEKAGWKTGSVSEFLGLTPEEEVLVEIKLALADKVKELRKQRRVTQAALAKRIGSSQSRIAKLESADRSVSVDLLVRSLASLGASQKDIGGAISKPACAAKPGSGKKQRLAAKSSTSKKQELAAT